MNPNYPQNSKHGLFIVLYFSIVITLVILFVLILNYFRIISLSDTLFEGLAVLPQSKVVSLKNIEKVLIDPYSEAVNQAQIYYTFQNAEIHDVIKNGSTSAKVRIFVPKEPDIDFPLFEVDSRTKVSLGQVDGAIPGSVTNLSSGMKVTVNLMYDFKVKTWSLWSIYILYDQGQ